MLKRTQILLEGWQVDHYKSIAQKYDVSFSKMIRMALCMDIITVTRIAFPKYKVDIDDKILKKSIKAKSIIRAMSPGQFHNFLSKVYFEARKAAEFWAK